LQPLFQSALHFYEKRKGSESVLMIKGSGRGSERPKYIKTLRQSNENAFINRNYLIKILKKSLPLPDPLANNFGGIDEIVQDGVVDSLSNK
jgi:hypothetical protein